MEDVTKGEVNGEVGSEHPVASVAEHVVAGIGLGIKVLIVEDDVFLSSIILSHLQKEGYTVTVVPDGEEALASVEKEIPHLILLDLLMPRLGGFEVLKHIRADKRYKDILIIIFSNLGETREIEESKRLGADEFMVKVNFTPNQVVAKIHALLVEKGIEP